MATNSTTFPTELWLEISQRLPLSPSSHDKGILAMFAISCKMLHEAIEKATNDIALYAHTAPNRPGTYISAKDFANNWHKWHRDGSLSLYRFSVYQTECLLESERNNFIVKPSSDFELCNPVARYLHIVPLVFESGSFCDSFAIKSYANGNLETDTSFPTMCPRIGPQGNEYCDFECPRIDSQGTQYCKFNYLTSRTNEYGDSYVDIILNGQRLSVNDFVSSASPRFHECSFRYMVNCNRHINIFGIKYEVCK
jgi:hypothetical protein